MFKKLGLLFVGLVAAFGLQAAPANFTQAKNELRQYIYHDQNRNAGGDLYCGCDWEWVGRSGGRVDLKACGYKIRAQPNRAERIEWEHIVPASNFGRARQCWQNGGRKNCTATDPIFSKMEADMHNLAPAVGEINADRQNYNFGFVGLSSFSYGACDFKVDTKNRIAEPKNEIKGMLARVYFYMHDRYNLPMSRQQQQLLMQWDKQYPPSQWELERDRRIAARMGHSNPFVTGEIKWSLGHKNSGVGLSGKNNQQAVPHTASAQQLTSHSDTTPSINNGPIRGNRNSKIYHFPQGCPSYDKVAPHNRVEFPSAAAAEAAGYRMARNCK